MGYRFTTALFAIIFLAHFDMCVTRPSSQSSISLDGCEVTRQPVCKVDAGDTWTCRAALDCSKWPKPVLDAFREQSLTGGTHTRGVISHGGGNATSGYRQPPLELLSEQVESLTPTNPATPLAAASVIEGVGAYTQSHSMQVERNQFNESVMANLNPTTRAVDPVAITKAIITTAFSKGQQQKPNTNATNTYVMDTVPAACETSGKEKHAVADLFKQALLSAPTGSYSLPYGYELQRIYRIKGDNLQYGIEVTLPSGACAVLDLSTKSILPACPRRRRRNAWSIADATVIPCTEGERSMTPKCEENFA